MVSTDNLVGITSTYRAISLQASSFCGPTREPYLNPISTPLFYRLASCLATVPSIKKA